MEFKNPNISIARARKLLGKKALKMSDDEIQMHIQWAEALADIAVTHLIGSKLKSGLLREPNPGETINVEKS